MGLMSKLFGEKKVVHQTEDGTPVEESLKYDGQIMTTQVFRQAVNQGVSVRAFRDGNFIPLKNLGKDLLIYDLNAKKYIPLQESKNQEHDDLKRIVFGG